MSKKMHIIGDPTSSPYNPVIGATVIYRPHKDSNIGTEAAPAIIMATNFTYEGDYVDLCAFTPTGNYFFKKVKYSEEAGATGVWHWMEKLVKRDVKTASTEAENHPEPQEGIEMDAEVSTALPS